MAQSEYHQMAAPPQMSRSALCRREHLTNRTHATNSRAHNTVQYKYSCANVSGPHTSSAELDTKWAHDVIQRRNVGATCASNVVWASIPPSECEQATCQWRPLRSGVFVEERKRVHYAGIVPTRRTRVRMGSRQAPAHTPVRENHKRQTLVVHISQELRFLGHAFAPTTEGTPTSGITPPRQSSHPPGPPTGGCRSVARRNTSTRLSRAARVPLARGGCAWHTIAPAKLSTKYSAARRRCSSPRKFV